MKTIIILIILNFPLKVKLKGTNYEEEKLFRLKLVLEKENRKNKIFFFLIRN